MHHRHHNHQQARGDLSELYPVLLLPRIFTHAPASSSKAPQPPQHHHLAVRDPTVVKCSLTFPDVPCPLLPIPRGPAASTHTHTHTQTTTKPGVAELQVYHRKRAGARKSV